MAALSRQSMSRRRRWVIKQTEELQDSHMPPFISGCIWVQITVAPYEDTVKVRVKYWLSFDAIPSYFHLMTK